MRRVAALSLTALGLALLGFEPILGAAPRLVFNASRSAPVGFYRIVLEPLGRGDFALLRPPERARILAEERGYLPPGVPLIKRVEAVAGDVVCRLAEGVFVAGKRRATALDADHLGRPMPVWSGCRRLRAGEFFLLQDHPRSFDSRYFGVADLSLILGKARPLWLFGGGERRERRRCESGKGGRSGADGRRARLKQRCKAPLSPCLHISYCCTRG